MTTTLPTQYALWVLVLAVLSIASPRIVLSEESAARDKSKAVLACEVSYHPLASISALKAIETDGAVPEECDVPQPSQPREINYWVTGSNFCEWESFFCNSSPICHKPLFFEDRSLERYGRCKRHQTLLSAAHFGANVLLLPAKRHWVDPQSCVRSPCATR